jgi:membrane protein DedA with SNARE-associated domain
MQEWITNLMTSMGYLGIGLLMFLENLFPPIPSELIMPLAGFNIAKGKMEFLPAIAAGTIGTVLGAFPWFYLGRQFSEERIKKLLDRYGKWLRISGKDIDKAQGWFTRFGPVAVLIGRLIPGVRTLISLPAGMAEMSLAPFLLYSTIGTTLWVSLLVYAGYLLGDNYEDIEGYLAPFSKIILGLIVGVILVWLLRKYLRSRNYN